MQMEAPAAPAPTQAAAERAQAGAPDEVERLFIMGRFHEAFALAHAALQALAGGGSPSPLLGVAGGLPGSGHECCWWG